MVPGRASYGLIGRWIGANSRRTRRGRRHRIAAAVAFPDTDRVCVPLHNQGTVTAEQTTAERGAGGLLLKWAGGKRQLLPQIRRFYPASFSTYVEPFVGSGAVFFDLFGAGRLRGRRVVLADTNPDLIGCYRMVRDHTAEVASCLEALAEAHAAGGAAHYYAVRDERFNPARAERRLPDGDIAYTPELAAMMIYLNRTGFNGLFRVNRAGHFNVPAGRYMRPTIVDRRRIERAAAALAPADVRLEHGPFTRALESADRGAFVYIDPPYEPVSRTASFTSYTPDGFGQSDQVRLQEAVIGLAERGCQVLLSNSTAEGIAALYADNPRVLAAGLQAYRVPARRAINSVATRRGTVDEYLITNIAPL
jgi:DNA adenine methylase